MVKLDNGKIDYKNIACTVWWYFNKYLCIHICIKKVLKPLNVSNKLSLDSKTMYYFIFIYCLICICIDFFFMRGTIRIIKVNISWANNWWFKQQNMIYSTKAHKDAVLSITLDVAQSSKMDYYKIYFFMSKIIKCLSLPPFFWSRLD